VSGWDETLTWNPIVTQNYIYLASSGRPNKTYVLDRTTHEVVWETDGGSYLTVANGYLYTITSPDFPFTRTLRAFQAQEP